MKEYRVKVMTPKHITVEEVEHYVSREYPGCEIIYSTESILPDVLEDEETGEVTMIIYVYYVHIRKEN